LSFKPRFIDPMLLLRTEKLPEGPDWLYELKLDGCMSDEVWRWSERFTRALGEAAQFVLPSRGVAAEQCLRQVGSARELYRQGDAAPLRILYDYWNNLAGDDIESRLGLHPWAYHEWQERMRGGKGRLSTMHDHDQVRALKVAGKKAEEIAAELGISVPSVYRILAKGKKQ
jgi:hypothetical protein